MDVPGSGNQRDRRRRRTSSPPSSPEMEYQLGNHSDRLLKSRRVDSESAQLEESFSNAEIEMSSLYRELQQCLAEEISSDEALEMCMEDKIDSNTLITDCSKMVGQYRTLGKEVNRAANTRNEEKMMYEDLHEEDQGGTELEKCLQKSIEELEKEIMEIIVKRKAMEEELRQSRKVTTGDRSNTYSACDSLKCAGKMKPEHQKNSILLKVRRISGSDPERDGKFFFL